MNYRFLAAAALVRTIVHVLFGRYVQVAKFGTLSVDEDSQLAMSDFQFQDQWLTGTMHCDGVTSEKHPELLNRAAIAVAVTILLGVFYQPKRAS